MRIVTPNWLPPCKMERVITHWTAGGYRAGPEDGEHYHLLVQGDGTLVRGRHSIAANVVIRGDNYAAHTRGLNTGSIGVSCCAMAGAQQSPFRPGRYPLKSLQYEKLLLVVADLAEFYEIPVDDHHILNHGEVQAVLGIEQNGKWDICALPFRPEEKNAGHYMRQRVQEILSR